MQRMSVFSHKLSDNFRLSIHPAHVYPLQLERNSSKWVGKIAHSYDIGTFRFVKGRRLIQFQAHANTAETDQPKWWEKVAGPNMIDIHSTQEFLNALSEAGDRLVIAEFYGTWCASCRALFPKLCKIAEEHPEILFLKVNFDENKTLCKSLNVKVLPYFHLYMGADHLVDSFSCSLVKLQRLKDAIMTHNASFRPETMTDSYEISEPVKEGPT